MKKFDGFQLKLFMMILMVFDHLDHIPGFIGPNLGTFFHMITRCVALWFAFGVVEGMKYTRSKTKYNVRLFMWAGIMFGINMLVNTVYASADIHLTNNIFLTLALGALMINIIEFNFVKVKKIDNIIKTIAIIGILMIGLVKAEGAIPVLPFILLTYAFKNNVKNRDISYIVLSILMFALNFQMYSTIGITIEMILLNCDWLVFTIIPFLHMYNGERGLSNKFTKYLFYVFYPAHLIILSTIGYFVAK